MKKQYVIGVDFGTDSVRSSLIDAGNGNKVVSSFYEYPRWAAGLFCDASRHQFRQHPLDYLEGLEGTIKDCLLKSSVDPQDIKAISVATTGSTPCVVNEAGVPLSLTPGFENDPDAMFILWKDHTAVSKADAINLHAKKYAVDYLAHSGGIYSAEWFWAKWLQVIELGVSMVEHSDWIPFVLTGGTDIKNIKRNVCAAGHKAMWSDNMLPPNHFFVSLDPRFKNKIFFDKVYTAAQPAGNLSKAWAEKLGLSTQVVVGVGALDAHMGAVGANIQPYHLCKVMGTSTCDMLVVPGSDHPPLVLGICGQVEGSVIPGMVGMEAGQSAFGDVFAWFKNMLSWGQEKPDEKLLDKLSVAAAALPLLENDPLAVDWFNGRRTPDVNYSLTAAITNLHLGSGTPQIFKALVEAACFGSKAIIDCFEKQQVQIKGIIALGGIAHKSPYVVQTMADTLQKPIRISRSTQSCALGAAMFAAVAVGIYPTIEAAMQAMNQGFEKEYLPDPSKAGYYDNRYERYKQLGNFIQKRLNSIHGTAVTA